MAISRVAGAAGIPAGDDPAAQRQKTAQDQYAAHRQAFQAQLQSQLDSARAQVDAQNRLRTMYQTKAREAKDNQWRHTHDPLRYAREIKQFGEEYQYCKGKDREAYMWADTMYQSMISSYLSGSRYGLGLA